MLFYFNAKFFATPPRVQICDALHITSVSGNMKQKETTCKPGNKSVEEFKH